MSSAPPRAFWICGFPDCSYSDVSLGISLCLHSSFLHFSLGREVGLSPVCAKTPVLFLTLACWRV